MTKRKPRRREYGTGSVYPTASGLWRATVEGGIGPNGKRRRLYVSGKTEELCRQRLKEKQRALALTGETDVSPRATVHAWTKEWLPIVERRLRPNAYGATASAVRRWIVPTIGHVRFDALQPAHVRAVANAQRDAGRSSSTQLRTHSVLMSLLRAALVEGYPVTDRVLAVDAPRAAVSDRTSMRVEEAVAVLEAAAGVPQASRWVGALLNGVRQGEALGLTWEEVDFDRGELVLAWQLQPLTYRVPRDRSSGFRIPDGYEVRQLHGRLHLARPKTRAGWRVLPMTPWFRGALEAWRDVAPASPHGLVWPLVDGRPCPSKVDDEEWYALQETAGVHHPTRTRELGGSVVPAPYTIHETRHTTATLLHEAGTDPAIMAAILGQTKLVESYLHLKRSPRVAEALQLVADQLALPGQASSSVG